MPWALCDARVLQREDGDTTSVLSVRALESRVCKLVVDVNIGVGNLAMVC